MPNPARAAAALLLAALLVCAAPLAGVVLAGRSAADFLAFPPRARHVVHAGFDWTAFFLYLLPAVVAAGAFARALRKPPGGQERKAPGRWPGWTWIGAALIAAGWTLAWREGLVPAEWRRHAFTLLWLGYIIVMNALRYRRSGRSPLTHRTAWFLSLFPVSAAFWWLFEYLNQFSGNWYYAGVSASGALDYFVQASLPFSTVLPAVASTWAWLASLPRLDSLSLPPIRAGASLAGLALAAGLVSLAALPLWPEALFSALWLGPVCVLASLQWLVMKESLFAPLAHGDWRPVLQPAVAALACGFFWELWNYGSLAKWHYSIPYVDRFHLFEMPLLGYAGYLPFGIECALVLQLSQRLLRGAPPSDAEMRQRRLRARRRPDLMRINSARRGRSRLLAWRNTRASWSGSTPWPTAGGSRSGPSGPRMTRRPRRSSTGCARRRAGCAS